MTGRNQNPPAALQRWTEVRSRIARYRREPLAVVKAVAATVESEVRSFVELGFRSRLWFVSVVGFGLLLLIEQGVFNLENWNHFLIIVGGMGVFPRWYYGHRRRVTGAGWNIWSRLWVGWVVFWVCAGLLLVVTFGAFTFESWLGFLLIMGMCVVLPRWLYVGYLGGGRHTTKKPH